MDDEDKGDEVIAFRGDCVDEGEESEERGNTEEGVGDGDVEEGIGGWGVEPKSEGCESVEMMSRIGEEGLGSPEDSSRVSVGTL